jgi:hypothetical protein
MSVTSDQRDLVLTLLREGVRSSEEIAQDVGIPKGSVSAIKAVLARGLYEDNLDAGDLLEEVGELKFGLERDLQLALRSNIQQLESGLEINDGGKERTTAAGRIDITAKDLSGATVVIELKAGIAAPEALTQLLAYIGAVGEEGDMNPRGLLIAQDFHPRLLFAAKATPNVKLLRYGFEFSFGQA